MDEPAPHHTTPPPSRDPAWHTRVEHVWVKSQVTFGDERYPGVLCGWRRDRLRGWLGWVVFVDGGIPAHAHNYGPALHMEWVTADRISKV